MNEYEIDGVCVRMTASMAARWNSGEWTKGDYTDAMIVIPDQHTQTSWLSCGEVVLNGVRVKPGDCVSFRDACRACDHPILDETAPANLIREGVK